MSAVHPQRRGSSDRVSDVVPAELVDQLTRACESREGHPISGGREIRFRCPVHAPDVHPSARWNPDKAVWRCDACEAGGGAFDLAGLLDVDVDRARPVDYHGRLSARLSVTPSSATATTSPAREERLRMPSRVVAVYAYGDELRVLRYEPKSFRPQHLVDGTWVVGRGPDPWPLYRQEHIPNDHDFWVHITEGERDADTLAAMEWIAVSPGSSTNPWLPTWTEALRQRHVVIHADNDEPGRKRASLIAGRLIAHAASVRVVQYPQQGPGGDVTDYLSDHTSEELEALIDGTPPLRVVPVPEPADGEHDLAVLPVRQAIVQTLSDIAPKPIDWLWRGWLPRGKITVLGGRPGEGKSTIALSLAATLSRGGKLPDGQQAPMGSTLLVLAEDDLADTVRPRLDAHGANASLIHAIEVVREADGKEKFLSLSEHVPELRIRVLEHNISCLVIDPLTAFLPKADRNAEGDVRDALMPLLKLAQETGIAVLGIMHIGKSTGTGRKPLQTLLGSTAFGAMARVVWMTADLPEDKQPAKGEDGTRTTHKIMGVVKSNVSQKPPPWVWCRPMDGAIRWLGRSDMSIEDVISGESSVKPIDEAQNFLREYLEDHARFAQDVKDEAKNRGIAEKTLYRAKEALKIVAIKSKGQGARWIWALAGRSQDVVESSSSEPPGEGSHPTDEEGEDGHFPEQVTIFPRTEDGQSGNVTTFPAESEDGHRSGSGHLPVPPLAEGEDGHLRGSTRAPARGDDAGASASRTPQPDDERLVF